MRVGGMFDGCGGLALGLEYAGHETVWHAELDESCARVLAERWPGAPNHGDVTAIDYAALEQVECISAGFPCQPVSLAGEGRAFADPRWLWPQVLRAVCALRPRHVLLENVPGIFRRVPLDAGGDVQPVHVVISDLAAAGYVGSFVRLRASDIGAPHGRDRWFCVATDADCEGRRQVAGGTHGDEGADAGRGATHDYGGERRAPRSGLREGESGRVGRGRSADDVEEDAGRAAATNADRRRREGVGITEPSRIECPHGSVADGCDEDGGLADPSWGEYAAAVERWERILGVAAPRPTDDRGRLMPEFVEWMLGLPVGWTDVGVARTKRLFMLGNSVQVQCAQVVGHWLTEEAGRYADRLR